MCVAEETNNCEAARRFSVSEKLIRGRRKAEASGKSVEGGTSGPASYRQGCASKVSRAGKGGYEPDDAR